MGEMERPTPPSPPGLPPLPDGRRLGPHLPLGNGMVRAVERAAAIGATALQIFADNPTAWRRRAAPPAELPTFRQRLVDLDIQPLAIHAAYLVNLAGSDPGFRERSIEVLASELRVAPGFGARFVNVHVGSHRGSGVATGTARVGEGLARALGDTDPGLDAPTVVLENSAGGGDGFGTTVPELADLLEAAATHGADASRIAFCLDLAHLWGAGHRISEPDVTDALLEEFNRRIGLGRLVMIHLNDSRAELGSHADRHQHLGAGLIGEAGLGHFIRHPRLAGTAFLLETPGMDEGYDAVNVARARQLAAGQPLGPLPPEAFETTGRSRSARGGAGPTEAG